MSCFLIWFSILLHLLGIMSEGSETEKWNKFFNTYKKNDNIAPLSSSMIDNIVGNKSSEKELNKIVIFGTMMEGDEEIWIYHISNIANALYKIEDFYKTVKIQEKYFNEYESDLLLLFADQMFSKDGLQTYSKLVLSHSIPNMISDANMNSSILQLMKEHVEPFSNICQTRKSFQQILFHLYKAIIIRELKCYLIYKHAYKIFERQSGNKFELLKKALDVETNEKIVKITETFRKYMISASDVWRCDPDVPEEGKTYIDLNANIRDQVVVAENIDCSSLDFRNKKEFKDNWIHIIAGRTFNKKLDHFCGIRNLYDCRNHTELLKVCYMQEYVKVYKNKDKFKSEPLRDILRSEDCEFPLNGTTFNDTMCICTCEDRDRHRFYMHEGRISADHKENYVVTGLRFKTIPNLHGNVNKTGITIQIQQGKLVKYGKIDQNTVHWIENDLRSFDNEAFVEINRKLTFNTLSYEERKSEVVVGLRLSSDRSKTYFEMKPLTKSFNFSTGLLSNEFSALVGFSALNKTYRDVRLFNLTNLDIPTKAKNLSVADESVLRVWFGPSNFNEDRGQTTIPFIDIQEVTTNPATPLGSVNLYYKGSEGYGGYLALKLRTYDLTNEDLFPLFLQRITVNHTIT